MLRAIVQVSLDGKVGAGFKLSLCAELILRRQLSRQERWQRATDSPPRK